MITKQPTYAPSSGVGNESAPQTMKDQSKPLRTCILIDYRPSSRERVRNHIQSTQLYEEVAEPGSLQACLTMILKQRVDTCVFGPSVKTEKIREFMDKIRQSSEPLECAFIASRIPASAEPIEGVHTVIDFPCSQSAFNASVVSAITKAHGGVLPEAKRYEPSTGKPVPLHNFISRLEYPKDQSLDAVIRESRPSLWPRETFDYVLRNSKKLRDSLAELQPFHLRFRTDGTPTEFTTETILGLIDAVYPNADTVPGMSKFRVVLEELLYKWAQIGSQLGRRTADLCLKREIINCFGLSIQ